MSHLSNFNEKQLISAIKPLLVNQSWEYFQEFLQRERSKQVSQMTRLKDPVDIHRAQGSVMTLETLLALKTRVLEAS